MKPVILTMLTTEYHLQRLQMMEQMMEQVVPMEPDLFVLVERSKQEQDKKGEKNDYLIS